MARDLIGALWPASFKGVPFWIEKDDEEGGRRLVIHQFPRRDDPFIEDLGRHAKKFKVDGYCVGDDYDTATADLKAALDAEGAGTLVLPVDGPVTVRCPRFSRNRSKDRIGYIALSIEFVREGATSALVSVDYLAQIAFDANDAVAALASDLFGQLSSQGQPSWINAATVAGLQDTVAGLDAMRSESNVDPIVSGQIGNALETLYAAIPAAVSPVSGVDTSIVAPLFLNARALGAAIPPAGAVAVFGEAIDAVAQPASATSISANVVTAAANAGIVARLTRLVMLSAYVDGVVNATYASRPDGITARANLVGRFDQELAYCNGAANVDLYVALQDLRNAGVDYLSQLIATLAPVLTVQTKITLPSLVLAWRLYADPSRATELVTRNNVRHPSYMPLVLEALAPTVAAS